MSFPIAGTESARTGPQKKRGRNRGFLQRKRFFDIEIQSAAKIFRPKLDTFQTFRIRHPFSVLKCFLFGIREIPKLFQTYYQMLYQ